MIKPNNIWTSCTLLESSVSLQISYVATCFIFPNGGLQFKTDPEGQCIHAASYWRDLIDEAERIGRYYYGDTWGRCN